MTTARLWLSVRVVAVLLIVGGLAVDAYVHFDLAPTYDPITSGSLSQGDLFRAEGVVAVLAALAVLIRPRRYTAAVAFVVAGSALAAALVYRYVNVGPIGPIPSMYEPVWYPEKLRATWAEAIAALASAVLLVALQVRRRQPSEHRSAVLADR